MINWKRIFAMSAVGGLLLVAMFVLYAGFDTIDHKAVSQECARARHQLTHQESAMLQCAHQGNCLLSAEDFSKHDFLEEDVIDVCPADGPYLQDGNLVLPDGTIIPLPQQAPPSQQPQADPAPRPEGPLKHDGFTAEQK
jgi:hypothetical protein